MSQERELELEKEESWDYERPEVREPVRASRVVVSVAFRRDDFEPVSRYADRIGKKISEFIREAAIERAGGGGGRILMLSGGSGFTFWGPVVMASNTRVFALPITDPDEAVATTS
jgi:hypothetical protein